MMARAVRDSRNKGTPVSARKRAESHKSGYESTSLNLPEDKSKLFKLTKAGTKRIDIIPYVAGEGNKQANPGDLYFERTYWIHRGIGPSQDNYVCPAKTADKPCPICEYRARLAKDPSSDEDLIKDLAPRERQLWNVIDLDEPDAGVKVWDISYHLFGKLLDTEIRNADEDEDFEYYPDLERGKTLKLGVEDKSFGGNTFYEVVSIGFKQRSRQYDEDILEEVHNLDSIVQILPYDKLKSIFLQTEESSEEEEDEEPEEKPKKKTTKPVKADEGGDEDEEPEEKPKKKVTKPSNTDEEETWPVTADEVGIEVGMRVRHPEFGLCKVVKISGDGTSLYIESRDGEFHRGVGPDEVEISAKKKEETPVEKVKKDKPEVKKTVPKPSENDDEDWDQGWDDEDEKSAKKPSSKKAPAKSKVVESNEEDEDDWD